MGRASGLFLLQGRVASDEGRGDVVGGLDNLATWPSVLVTVLSRKSGFDLETAC